LILSFHYSIKTQAISIDYTQSLGKIDRMDEFKKIGILIIGWIFIGLGILGLFLPILQGILFIVIGLAILSSRSALVRRFLRYIEQRYPHQHERIVHWKEKIRNWFKKDSVSG
jgi:uncharacterized membrane protein YbaN (DUF454 family)